jgi:hypothetical protein
MIPKSGHQFSEKVMLKQQAKAKCQFNLKSFRFSKNKVVDRRDKPRRRLNPRSAAEYHRDLLAAA